VWLLMVGGVREEVTSLGDCLPTEEINTIGTTRDYPKCRGCKVVIADQFLERRGVGLVLEQAKNGWHLIACILQQPNDA